MKRLTLKPGEIHQISDIIFRITLPQPFYAPNQVYLINDEMKMLIDSGYVESLGSLALALRTLGLKMNDIDILLYTHPHIDHITGGLLWSQYARRTERWGHHTLMRDMPDFPDSIDTWQADTARIFTIAFRDHKARMQRISRAQARWARFANRFTNNDNKQGDRAIKLDRLLKENDQFSTGKLQFTILETPGHNKWHITPVETTQGFVFTGDLLIGNIPAIYDNIDGNLEDFQRSLRKLLALRPQYPDMRFFPAHGEEITHPERAIKIVQKTLGIIENGIMKKLVEGRKGLLELIESAFGTKLENGNHFITALELMEALLRKLMREGKVRSEVYEGGYEEFWLVHQSD